MTSDRTRARREANGSSPLPAPGTDTGRRVYTFVDFAGPVTGAQVAQHLALPYSMVEWSLAELRAAGYLRYDPSDKLKYESRGRWNPDDGIGGNRSGPHTPVRRFHDVPLFSDSEPVERILRRPT